MTSGPERLVKKLQRRNSQGHVVMLFFLLVAIFCAALAARYYLLAPVQLRDASMAPMFKEGSIHWMCKFPQCISSITEKDIVWITLKNKETMVRKVLALPGDSIEITDKGAVRTPYRKFKWKEESYFIQSRKLYVPKLNDTLYFDKLNDIEQDYIISYLINHGIPVSVQTTLWQGDHEMNIERVGSTKIANRQVSLKEINFLPWQDRYLIELQIRHSEPGNAPIKLKRRLFLNNTPKVAVQDSSEFNDTSTLADTLNKADSTIQKDSVIKADTIKVADTPRGIPLNEIVIQDNCYYLTCEKGENCPDSRELGYFTNKDIIGKYIEWPDQFKKKAISPIRHYIEKAVEKVLELFITEEPKEISTEEAVPTEEQSEK